MMEKGVTPNGHSKICSRHFTEDSFKEGRTKKGKELKPGAYPTIKATDFLSVPPSRNIEIQQMDVASSQNLEAPQVQHSENYSTFDVRMIADSRTVSTSGVTTSSDSQNISIPDMPNNLGIPNTSSFRIPANIDTAQMTKIIYDKFFNVATFLTDLDIFCTMKQKSDGQVVFEQKIYSSHFTEDIPLPEVSASIGKHRIFENGPTNTVSSGSSYYSDNYQDVACQTMDNIDNEKVNQDIDNHAVSSLPIATTMPTRTNVIVSKETNIASSYVGYGEMLLQNNEVRASADSGIEIQSPPNSERSLNIQNSPCTVSSRIATPQSQLSDFHRTVVINRSRTPTLSPANSSASVISTGGNSSYRNLGFRNLPPTVDSLIEIKDGSDIFTAYSSFILKVVPLPTQAKANGSFNSFSSVKNPSALLQALVYENFYTEPTKWLLEKQLVSKNYLCNPCSQPMQLSSGGNGSPNCQWTCLWCKKRELFVKPTLFSHFPNTPLQDLLVIMYHWAVLSDLKDIFLDIKFKMDTALSVLNGLRQFCAAIIREVHPTIGGDNVVEVTMVKFGAFYVIAAMERISKFTRLKAIPVETCIDLHPEMFQDIIASWLKPGTSVVHESNNSSDGNISSEGECYDIIYYLKTRLQEIFGQYDTNTLKIEFFQACLDELQWRERWGHDGQKAFWNMLHFIFGSRYENACPLPDNHPFNLPEINRMAICPLPDSQLYNRPGASQMTVCPLPDSQLYNHPGASQMTDDIQDSLHSDASVPLQVREFNISESSMGTCTPLLETNTSSVGIEENSVLSDNTTSSTLAVSVTDTATNFVIPKPEPPDDMEFSNMISSASDLSIGSMESPIKSINKSEPQAIDEGTEESMHYVDPSWNNEHFVPNIPTLQEGNLDVSYSELLGIQTWPLPDFPNLTISETIQINHESETKKLEADLTARELLTCPVEWMYNSSTLLSGKKRICPDCNGHDLQMIRCLSIDEFFYSCARSDCHWQERFVRPKIFSNFGLPLRNITILMFHWAVQSDFDTVIASVSKQVDSPDPSFSTDRTMSLCAMPCDAIWNFYETLQNALTSLLSSKKFLLGGSNHTVEANVIKFGIFYILCALEREEKKKFRFQVFPITAGWEVKTFVKQIEAWLLPKTVVISPFEGYDLEKNQITHYPTDPDSDTVTVFSKSMMSFLFGNFCTALLPIERIQGLLNEVVWRQHSQTLSSIFFGMLSQLIKLYGKDEPNDTPMNTSAINASAQESFIINSNLPQPSTFAITSAVDEIRVSAPTICDNSRVNVVASAITLTSANASNDIPFVPASKVSRRKNSAAGPRKCVKISSAASKKTSRSISTKKRSHASSCFNELEYYARVGNISEDQEHVEKIANSNFFKCFTCHEVIQGNFSAMTHIFSHYIIKRMEYLHKESLYICIYCCLEFESLNGLNYHAEQVHSVLENITCLLCSKLFSIEDDLMAHFHKHHNKCEMPYSCKICTFRSSLYVDVIDHFIGEHPDKDHLLCFVCFDQIPTRSDRNGYLSTEDFIDHLMKHHNKVAGQYKCKSCCLVFCTDEERIAHKIHDHVSFPNMEDITTFQDKMPLYRTHSFAWKNQYFGYQQIVSQSSNNDSQMVHIYFGVPSPPIKLPNFPGTSNCFECKQPMDKKHFLQDYQCCHCSFQTLCAIKFRNHKNNFHLNPKKRLVGSIPFKFIMECQCGFSFSDGNEMASHMLNCSHHGTCFTRKFPPPSTSSSS